MEISNDFQPITLFFEEKKNRSFNTAIASSKFVKQIYRNRFNNNNKLYHQIKS